MELTPANSYSNGYGDGYGYGNGDGYGDGHGYGDGYSNGSGYGYGNGYGYSNGYGSGCGADFSQFPSKYLDPILVLKETNIEIRRDLIEAIGISRVIQKLGAKSIEKKGNYELLNFNIIDGNFRPYLKMLNPSVGVWHVEGVRPSCNTIKKALNWRNQSTEKPKIIT